MPDPRARFPQHAAMGSAMLQSVGGATEPTTTRGGGRGNERALGSTKSSGDRRLMGPAGDGPQLVSRRSVLRGAAGVALTMAGVPLLASCGSDEVTPADDQADDIGEGTLETPTVRLARTVITSVTAQAVASEFLKEEGFTDVQYIDVGRPETVFEKLAAGVFDIVLVPAPMVTVRVDAGDPIVALGGINAGCFKIYGTEAIQSMGDFKGQTLSTSGPGLPDDVFLTVTLANVGVDVRKDVTVINRSHAEASAALVAGQVQGMTALPPFSHELSAQGIGHVVLDANVDRPWSQYFFSMPTAHRDYVKKYPVATLRVLRAHLRAADAIAKDPEQGAKAMLALGFIPQPLYEGTLGALREIPHDVWRRYDPADTLRFYALRLREAGLITGTPEEILERGTDFRFWRKLKRELKEA